jgi:hypothetical protein
MPYTSKPQASQNIFSRQANVGAKAQTHGDVWQDNGASRPGRAASAQPAAVATEQRAQLDDPPAGKTPRSQQPTDPHPRAVKVTLWVKPAVKDELARIATREQTSLSATGSAFLERAIQGHIDMQYGALLRPIIEGAIAARSRARDARFAALLVRIAYDVGQTRSLVTNLLARAPGVNPELLQTILDRSDERATANLTHLSPQITQLIEAVKQWVAEGGEEGTAST